MASTPTPRAIQSELGQLKSELNRIADTTTFNGKKLLDGSFQAAFQVGRQRGRDHPVNVGSTYAWTPRVWVSGVDVTGTGAFTTRRRGRRRQVSTTTAARLPPACSPSPRYRP